MRVSYDGNLITEPCDYYVNYLNHFALIPVEFYDAIVAEFSQINGYVLSFFARKVIT